MRVKNFTGFMKSKPGLNESYMSNDNMGYMPNDEYGANPEDEMPDDDETPEEEEGAEEEVTLEDLKAMIEDLTERVNKLEGGDEESEDEPAEGEESDEEPAEGEEPEEKE